MELKNYVEEVLIVLKKNTELERLMSNLAEDSALASVKNTILDIEKAAVKYRLVELTEQYLGKENFIEEKEKKKKRFSFVRAIGTSPTIDAKTTAPKLTRAQYKEEKKKKKEVERAEVTEKKRIQRKEKIEKELELLNKNE